MNERDFVHLSRLESDYQAMTRLRGPLTWEPLTRCDPELGIYPTKYRVTYQFLAPTISGNRREHTITIDCSSADYPFCLPVVAFQTSHIKHPHVYTSGNVCLGGFPVGESLVGLCIRLAQFFQYEPRLINPRSLASQEYYDWYIQNRSSLPLEPMKLPHIEDKPPKKFQVTGRRDVDQPNVSGLRVTGRR